MLFANKLHDSKGEVMSEILIGAFRFKVLKQDGSRVLLAWIESTGEQKERWFNLKNLKGQLK